MSVCMAGDVNVSSFVPLSARGKLDDSQRSQCYLTTGTPESGAVLTARGAVGFAPERVLRSAGSVDDL